MFCKRKQCVLNRCSPNGGRDSSAGLPIDFKSSLASSLAKERATPTGNGRHSMNNTDLVLIRGLRRSLCCPGLGTPPVRQPSPGVMRVARGTRRVALPVMRSALLGVVDCLQEISAGLGFLNFHNSRLNCRINRRMEFCTDWLIIWERT